MELNNQEWIVGETTPGYSNDFLDNPNLPYKIIGACMEVHRTLGHGFLEVVYKDALEIEFKLNGIPYEREQKFTVHYKGFKLPRTYNADFVINNEIILEAKAQSGIVEDYYRVVINYLAASGCKLGLIVNFAGKSLIHKRVILTKESV
ncbi:MAG TPA: GxxExxY protein [Bacteroidia bacterium]|nr:GxxExxY protein [Bacteroidia bacterium]